MKASEVSFTKFRQTILANLELKALTVLYYALKSNNELLHINESSRGTKIKQSA